MAYQILVLPSAQKELQGIPASDRKWIIARIDPLQSDARPHASQKLKGTTEQYRIRQGDYRILYRVDERSKRVFIYTVAHRREAYR
jgi:mRNA interferase RelE/StbE